MTKLTNAMRVLIIDSAVKNTNIPVKKAATALHDKEMKLRTELRNFLVSCTTVEKVIAKMPELERHCPPAVVKQFPVAVSTGKLTSLLDGMGFDTGAKK